MNVAIPSYLKTLIVLEHINTADKIIILDALNPREMFDLEKEVVTYKALLKAAIKKEVMTMIDGYSLQQLQVYDDSLCSAARARLERLIPDSHIISRFVGCNSDYSCFFECIDMKNKRNFKNIGRKLCPTLTTR